MTTAQTIKTLRKSGKPVSLTHLYRLFAVLNIAPIGRSRPQQYPDDTAERVLKFLGFTPQAKHVVFYNAVQNLLPEKSRKLISVRALRAAKPQPKTKGTK